MSFFIAHHCQAGFYILTHLCTSSLSIFHPPPLLEALQQLPELQLPLSSSKVETPGDCRQKAQQFYVDILCRLKGALKWRSWKKECHSCSDGSSNSVSHSFITLCSSEPFPPLFCLRSPPGGIKGLQYLLPHTALSQNTSKHLRCRNAPVTEKQTCRV